jgi:hypothetical protein
VTHDPFHPKPDRIVLHSRPLSSEREAQLRPTAAKMARIVRILRWIAILVPLALLAMISVDGISLVDVGVAIFVAAGLWLFVGIAKFTVGALAELEPKQRQPREQG